LLGRAFREQQERRKAGRPDLEEDDAQADSGAIVTPVDAREEAAAKASLGDAATWAQLDMLGWDDGTDRSDTALSISQGKHDANDDRPDW